MLGLGLLEENWTQTRLRKKSGVDGEGDLGHNLTLTGQGGSLGHWWSSSCCRSVRRRLSSSPSLSSLSDVSQPVFSFLIPKPGERLGSSARRRSLSLSCSGSFSSLSLPAFSSGSVSLSGLFDLCLLSLDQIMVFAKPRNQKRKPRREDTSRCVAKERPFTALLC